MTASIVGFVTRDEAGLVPPKSISKNITPADYGVSYHYGGGAQSAADPGSDHQRCIETWRGWQRHHMIRRNFVDIAYTGGFCNHGYAFAGRGLGVRTGANGTNHSNQHFYAIVWIGGFGQKPTELAINAADWWLEQLRRGGAGTMVKPHNFFKATGCPGDPLEGYCLSRDNKAIPTAPVAPKPTPAPASVVVEIQRAAEVEADGKWGPLTDARVMFMRTVARAKRGYPQNIPAVFDILIAQRVVDTVDDGKWGPNSQAALVEWIEVFQRVIGVKSDGWWGPKTDSRLLALRRRHFGNY